MKCKSIKALLKKTLTLLILAVFIGGLIPVALTGSKAAPDTLAMLPELSRSTVSVGDSLTVTLKVRDTGFASAQASLSYDSDKMEYVAAEDGALVTGGAQTGVLFVSRLGAQQPEGATVATLFFKAKAEGNARFTVSEAQISQRGSLSMSEITGLSEEVTIIPEGQIVVSKGQVIELTVALNGTLFKTNTGGAGNFFCVLYDTEKFEYLGRADSLRYVAGNDFLVETIKMVNTDVTDLGSAIGSDDPVLAMESGSRVNLKRWSQAEYDFSTNGSAVDAFTIQLRAKQDVTLADDTFEFHTTDSGNTASGRYKLIQGVIYNDVNIGAMTDGTVTASPVAAKVGDTVNLTAKPNVNYKLEQGSMSVTGASGSKVSVSGSGNNYTFTMPNEPVTVSASFEYGVQTYPVTVAGGAMHGTVTTEKTAYAAGEEVIVTVTPGEGYRLAYNALTYNVASSSGNRPIGKNSDGQYAFTMPAERVTINGTHYSGTDLVSIFETDYHPVIDPDVEHGTLSYEFDIGYRYVLVTYVPEPSYRLVQNSITYDGVPITSRAGVSDYRFEMPVGNPVVSAKFEPVPWDGSGTEAYPWLISTPAHMRAIAEDALDKVTYAGYYFKLANDIVLDYAAGKWISIGYLGGNNSRPFSGTFDGAGHTIRTVINDIRNDDDANKQGDYIPSGIFGYVKDATIKNIVVTGSVNVYSSVGGLVSHADNSRIENCGNEADISAGEGAAGLVYTLMNASTVSGCYNSGNISIWNKSGVGGLICQTQGSSSSGYPTIINSYNIGTVDNGDTPVNGGGLVGSGAVRTENCYNAGTVTDKGHQGISAGYSTNCYILAGATEASEPDEAGRCERLTSAELKAAASRLGGAYVTGPNYPILKWQAEEDQLVSTVKVTGNTAEAKISGTGYSSAVDSEGGLTLTLAWDDESVTAVHVDIDAAALAAMAAESTGVSYLGLNTDLGDVSLDAAALSAIKTAAGGEDVRLAVSALTASGNATAQDLIEKGIPVYEITLKTAGGNDLFTSGGGGKAAVTLPYDKSVNTKTTNVIVYHIADSGAKTDMKAGYTASAGRVSFETSHFSLYSIEQEEKPGPIKNEDGSVGNVNASVWDGVSLDLTWYKPGQAAYYIGTPAQLAGLAAIVNGIYNEEIVNIVGEKSYIVNNKSTGGSSGPQGNNKSTETYHYGGDDFNGKTVYLTADIDMGASNNYMPIGGQYLMTPNDYDTKISSSFCGTLDGQGHSITIYADRHCSTGNYGDGESVGLIGRLGVHDMDDVSLRPYQPSVLNLAVYGSVRGNRSIGGIVGKIGKIAYNNGDTTGGALIENCANFASVSNTDSKGIGGIVGSAWNGGVIRNCYNVGSVRTEYGAPAGGIAGTNEITIENCYNIGAISAPASRFAMGIGSYNDADNGHAVTNSYSLEGKAPGGGYFYGQGNVDTEYDIVMTVKHMTSDEFVAQLGEAYVKDTRGINGGYPVLAWQGGTAVPPSPTPNDNSNNETEADSTTTVDGDAATTIVDELIPLTDDPTLVVINVETDGAAVSSITAEVTAENVKAIAENGSAIEVRSELGNVTLSNSAVTDLADKADEKIDVKLTKDSADTYTLALTADDKAVATVDGGVKLTLTAEDADAGTVAVLVHEDGTEEVIKKSVGKDGTVSVPLEGSATVKLVDNAKDFGDVADGAWYNDAVRFASSHELLEGTGGGKFSPDTSMTRGMLVTVLYRLENEPDATGETFADVASDAYYAAAVTWASANSIVLGTGNGFAPNAPITREQLAVMLYRYTEWLSAGDGGRPGTVAPTDADLSGFPDADGVSDWAEDAMKWAVSAGLIQGRDSGLAPKGTATRAEVATILQRFIEQL